MTLSVNSLDMRFQTLLLLFSIALLPHRSVAGTILIVGDSLSAAYGMPVEQGWVALLQQRLRDERLNYDVVNSSISGETTASARRRLPQMLAKHQPEVVVLQLGGNDGLRGLSLEHMEDNLAAMIEAATRHGAQLLLIGVQLPPNYGQRYTQGFQAVYRELAAKYDIDLLPSIVDGVGERREFMQPDGIHPNARAQPVMLAQILPHLKSLLE
jgi:acyl-CoA thioesterase-1